MSIWTEEEGQTGKYLARCPGVRAERRHPRDLVNNNNNNNNNNDNDNDNDNDNNNNNDDNNNNNLLISIAHYHDAMI